MINIFSYVKYSDASFQMSSQYSALLIITILIWILLWIGYRNNKINDENIKRERDQKLLKKYVKRKKLESLYPKDK